MSIGLGIFLSVLVAIAAWQIDKRKKWKGAAIAFGALFALAFGSIAVYVWWSNGEPPRKTEQELALARSGKLNDYWDIRLGMSQNEVKYRRGQNINAQYEIVGLPDGVEAPWIYKGSDYDFEKHEYVISWTSDKRVRSVSCFKGMYSGCEPLLGIHLSTDEADIRKALGKPDEEKPPTDSGKKELTYGAKRSQISFSLERGRVVSMSLSDETQPFKKSSEIPDASKN